MQMATYRVKITQGQISCKDYGAVAQPHSKLRDLKRLRASKSLMYTFSPVMIRIIGRRSQPSLAVSRHSCQSSDICRDGYVFSLIFEHVRLGVCHNVRNPWSSPKFRLGITTNIACKSPPKIVAARAISTSQGSLSA
jgi:hypothetical protein